MNVSPATNDDRAFITSGWSASLRMTRDVPLIPMLQWAAIMRPVIEGILDRPGVSTVVARGEVLWGFLCYRADYVYYVYVAQPFRRNGVARTMFVAAGINPASRFGYACRTKASWELLSKHNKCPLAYYDPYRARFSEEQHEQRDNVR